MLLQSMKQSFDNPPTAMREDLNCKSLKWQPRYLISAASKTKRLDRLKKVAEAIENSGDYVFISLDENIE